MYIRCADCHASTWIETLVPGEAAPSVGCKSCGREYPLFNAGELGLDESEQYERALQFAEFNGIDLPSAYSVLLGVMDLEAAQAIRRENAATTPAPAESALEDAIASGEDEAASAFVPAAGAAPSYDEGFERAVRDGHLTAAQAIARGDRGALIHRLARRHALPRDLATAVADNRLSLAEARRRRPAETAESFVPPKEAEFNRLRNRVFAGVAVGIVVLLAAHGYRDWRRSVEKSLYEDGREARRAAAIEDGRRQAREQAPPATARVVPTNVQTDGEGRVMRVVGPDPVSVFKTFCSTGANAHHLEPLELTETIPPSSQTRLGIFRDRTNLGTLQAIRIRNDDGRWTIGDGRGPVVPMTAPRLPADAERVAVR